METISDFGVYERMLGRIYTVPARRLLFIALPIAFLGASASAIPSEPEGLGDPMRFFEGRTESISTIKVMMRKPFKSHTLGRGEIDDGVLSLVQRVNEDGKAPYERKWRMRQVAPGRFAGTMTEAAGPVSVEQVGNGYRFRFKMKGNLAIEQWLTPMPGGRVARSKVSIRKFGMRVGSSDGTIRKL